MKTFESNIIKPLHTKFAYFVISSKPLSVKSMHFFLRERPLALSYD
jgi:hypothetical protein